MQVGVKELACGVVAVLLQEQANAVIESGVVGGRVGGDRRGGRGDVGSKGIVGVCGH